MATLTHAGAIAIRRGPAGLEVLLIRPLSGAKEWLLPKGHIDPGESPEKTALRELREETGVEGQLLGFAGDLLFKQHGEPIYCRFFAIKTLHEGRPDEPRDLHWFAADKAAATLTFRDSAPVVRRALEIAAVSSI